MKLKMKPNQAEYLPHLIFDLPNILPPELQQPILPLDPTGHLGGIPLPNLAQTEVRGDHRVFPRNQPLIDQLIQGALEEGRGQLGPQIIHDEQVALHIPVRGGPGLPAELLRLKGEEHLHHRIVHHRVPRLGDHPGDGGPLTKECFFIYGDR